MDNLVHGIVVLEEVFEEDLFAGPTGDFDRATDPYFAESYEDIQTRQILHLEGQSTVDDEAVRMWRALDQFDEYRDRVNDPRSDPVHLKREIEAILENLGRAYRIMYDQDLTLIEYGDMAFEEEEVPWNIRKERALVLQKRFILKTLVQYWR
jgi:hypothetical protein